MLYLTHELQDMHPMSSELLPAALPTPIAYAHRALILDDNDANRLLLKLSMQMSALEHDEAHNGQTALKLCEVGKYSFAFLDIELPDISGLEVARQIRQKDQGIAIIMCSTNDDPQIVSKAIAAGADMFFVKPFQIDVMLKTLKAINRAGMRANPRVLIIDNQARVRWEERTPTNPN